MCKSAIILIVNFFFTPLCINGGGSSVPFRCGGSARLLFEASRSLFCLSDGQYLTPTLCSLLLVFNLYIFLFVGGVLFLRQLLLPCGILFGFYFYFFGSLLFLPLYSPRPATSGQSGCSQRHQVIIIKTFPIYSRDTVIPVLLRVCREIKR